VCRANSLGGNQNSARYHAPVAMPQFANYNGAACRAYLALRRASLVNYVASIARPRRVPLTSRVFGRRDRN